MKNKKLKAHRSKSKQGIRHEKRPNTGTLSASLFGAVVGLFTILLLAAICALICLRSSTPDKLTAPLGYVCSVLAYLIAGYCAVRKRGGAAIPCGMLSGVILTVTFFICSLFFKGNASEAVELSAGLLIRITMIIVSMLGAIMGALRKK